MSITYRKLFTISAIFYCLFLRDSSLSVSYALRPVSIFEGFSENHPSKDALAGEMVLYLNNRKNAKETKKDTGDDRIKYYSAGEDGEFIEKNVFTYIEVQGLTIYCIRSSSDMIIIKGLKPNERIATSQIYSCVGIAFNFNIKTDTFHGLVHLYSENFKKQSKGFIKKLEILSGNNIENLETVFYYSNEHSRRDGSVEDLKNNIQKNFPNVSIRDGCSNGKGYATSMMVSPCMWGIDHGYADVVKDREKNFRVWKTYTGNVPENRFVSTGL